MTPQKSPIHLFRYGLFTTIVCLMLGLTVPAQSPTPKIIIRSAESLHIPGASQPEAGIEDAVDSNCPIEWSADGRMYAFASVTFPYRSSGPDLFHLAGPAQPVNIERLPTLVDGIWLEATYRDVDGTLFGWYHNEIASGCENEHLRVPQIGAMVSYDEGLNWQDLGIIISAPDDSLNCETHNYYFPNGAGDFTVLLDRERQYFYFIFGSYNSQLEEQGTSLARLAYGDRFAPVDNVWKWHNEEWTEPGLRGHVTPVLRPQIGWHGEQIDAYWGPQVHFNTHLQQYVMLLNHAVDEFWSQEGVYVSFNEKLSNPHGWSEPQRLELDPEGRAYPVTIGIQHGETDKQLGQFGRLFLLGESHWELEFLRPEEDCITCLLPAAPLRIERERGESPTRGALSGSTITSTGIKLDYRKNHQIPARRLKQLPARNLRAHPAGTPRMQ